MRRLITRYRQLRETFLSEEYLSEYIDQVIDYLGPAIERNDAVWGYSYDPEQVNPHARRVPDENSTFRDVNPASYDDAVARMKEYLRARGDWMDAHIEELLQYCHPSKTAAQRVE